LYNFVVCSTVRWLYLSSLDPTNVSSNAWIKTFRHLLVKLMFTFAYTLFLLL